MNLPDEPVALMELLNSSAFDSTALRAIAEHFEHLAEGSGEAAYAASMCHELFDSEKRNRLLLHSAGLGLVAAQLDVAANFALGLNGFERDTAQFEHWISVAEKSLPTEARDLRARVQHEV